MTFVRYGIACAAIAQALAFIPSAALAQAGGTTLPPDAQPLFPTGREHLLNPTQLDAKALGSVTGDLVFTPLPPCRILDTRIAGGPIGANSSRAFLGVAINSGANFTSQGGSATNCGVAAVGASAISVNFTIVSPAGPGYLTVYKSGDTRPLAATLNYLGTDLVRGNLANVQIPNPLAITDFVIYAFSQVDVVADIVGYYSPPAATNLQCTQTALQNFNIAAGASTFFNNPLCPAGYHEVMPYCYAPDAGVNSAGSGTNSNTAGLATFCAWHNTTGTAKTVFGGSICCRVPGR